MQPTSFSSYSYLPCMSRQRLVPTSIHQQASLRVAPVPVIEHVQRERAYHEARRATEADARNAPGSRFYVIGPTGRLEKM
jgi:hypothetical protein